jgi:hypothetical protein
MASGQSDNRPLQVRMSAAGGLDGQAKKKLIMDVANEIGSSASDVVNALIDHWLGLATRPARPDHDLVTALASKILGQRSAAND